MVCVSISRNLGQCREAHVAVPCSKGMRRCYAGCLHRQMVQEFHLEREAWEQRVDSWSLGYSTEAGDYVEAMERAGRPDPPPTFRTWLIHRWATNRGERDGSDG
jgi:hypothetical protein